ncbi:unnamed protein product [Prorocentrum cordatum]|uniref:Uncharacterized protein n=1 Tax=Prorocentrum cordatum TaxID=2364126 RepID=A0ABN9SRG7_9DINO|nr:unnamed protein product [Polarella glacialis]
MCDAPAQPQAVVGPIPTCQGVINKQMAARAELPPPRRKRALRDSGPAPWSSCQVQLACLRGIPRGRRRPEEEEEEEEEEEGGRGDDRRRDGGRRRRPWGARDRPRGESQGEPRGLPSTKTAPMHRSMSGLPSGPAPARCGASR